MKCAKIALVVLFSVSFGMVECMEEEGVSRCMEEEGVSRCMEEEGVSRFNPRKKAQKRGGAFFIKKNPNEKLVMRVKKLRVVPLMRNKDSLLEELNVFARQEEAAKKDAATMARVKDHGNEGKRLAKVRKMRKEHGDTKKGNIRLLFANSRSLSLGDLSDTETSDVNNSFGDQEYYAELDDQRNAREINNLLPVWEEEQKENSVQQERKNVLGLLGARTIDIKKYLG